MARARKPASGWSEGISWPTPEKTWPTLREIVDDHFGKAPPNKTHEVLAHLEAKGLLKALITQNIDNLHS